MIKVFISVRNRLSITKKCIIALYRYTKLPLQIHIYDNLTNYKIREHFEYAYNLYKNGLIASYNFNTKESTFNAFSKAISFNQFGTLHCMDPNKNDYDFLLILDNDIIVLPDWDLKVKSAFEYIKNRKEIKIVSQITSGIKNAIKLDDKIYNNTIEMSAGKNGGSGFWCIRPNFFEDVGFLDAKNLVGKHKGHDIYYWRLLDKASNNKPYILGLHTKLCIHCGGMTGSICNVMSRGIEKSLQEKESIIKFESAEEEIEKTNFDDFIKKICEDKNLINGW